ncbi:Uroporphyrinogen decarboxylase in heme biosynthesis [Lunasporangiospora selenospora]|uniref:Uroporphyrinogen decarboxylase n=1 Tax=Lunasporangiospora selenospora TaxID=979761 RepID=A0A9P6KIK4_9FUNG|nr:Uroporphyrinogen decarboxylase in heme biosynthesis [Lunasporangiospora selenospora]
MADPKPFPPLKNDLILRAARGEKTERAPVWVMRQAGRYLPEFREERVMNDFFKICRTPELATKVTLQPIDRYDGLLDASIIFSDILVIPQALGMEVEMVPGKGPHFPDPLVKPEEVHTKLKESVDVNKELQYVFDAITMTRHALNGRVPLIGFVGAPWTLMSYMIEGGGSKTLSKAKEWLYKYPQESHELLRRITDVCVDFLVGQVRAGAQMLQVFESWGGELGPHEFEQFSLPYLAQIATRVKEILGRDESVPMTVFAKGSWYALDKLAVIGYETVSLDWTYSPTAAKAVTKGRVTLQGNMDPSVLLGGDEAIVATATRMVREFGSTGRYIANLGHGILPSVPVEGMELFLKTVHRVGLEVAAEEKAKEIKSDMNILG